MTGILAGEPRACARAISIIEDGAPEAREVLAALATHTGRAVRIGVTGPPGAGKSTLIDAMAQALRQRGLTVGIVAIDPTSPYTGGALLGDRVRMGKSGGDAGVFIRSMATRGAVGGISRAAQDAADVLDAAGKAWVVIETVGVGQSEVEVTRASDTTVVVVSPESGDQIQAMKAGIMEAADIFVVNKADRDGADGIAREIEEQVDLRPAGAWQPPVLLTRASEGNGVGEVLAAVERHRAAITSDGTLERRRRENLARRVRALAENALLTRLWGTEGIDAIVESQAAGLTVREAAEAVVKAFLLRASRS